MREGLDEAIDQTEHARRRRGCDFRRLCTQHTHGRPCLGRFQQEDRHRQAGRIEQQGTPTDIYERPASAYAAEFVGGANIISGHVGDNAGSLVTEGGIRIAARTQQPLAPGASACIAIHPQKIRLVDKTVSGHEGGTLVPFNAKTVLYQGANFEITGTTPFGEIRLLAARAPAPDEVQILLPAEECLCVAA